MSESLEPKTNNSTEFEKRLKDALWKTFLEEPIKKGVWFVIFSISATFVFWWFNPSWWSAVALGFASCSFLTVIVFGILTFRNYRNPNKSDNTYVKVENGIIKLNLDSPKSTERSLSESVKSDYQVRENVKPEPNIICIETSIKDVFFDRNRNCWIEDIYGERGAIIIFVNEPLENGEKIGELSRVIATIFFHNKKGKLIDRVDDGMWLNTRGSTWFLVGGSQTLLIAYNSVRNVIKAPNRQSQKYLSDSFYRVRIRLIGDNQWIKNFDFNLTIDEDGNMSIKEI